MAKQMSLGILGTCLLGALNCAMADDSNNVNIWNWSYNIGENTVSEFEKDTNLKTNYVEYDSNELQEARLLAGNTGFDAAIVMSYYIPRLAKAGALQKIDHSKIPNWVKLNHSRLEKLGHLDPNNEYAYPYIEDSIGIGYDKNKIKEIFGNDYKLESWDFLFDPKNSEKLKKCGIAIIDSPIEIISVVQHVLGKSPVSEDAKDFEETSKVLIGLAKNVSYFHSSRYVQDLAAGEICVAVGYSGDIVQSKRLSAHSKKNIDIDFVIPKEGSVFWYDSWTIPRGAKNLDNAYTWFNWLIEPKNATKLSDEIGYVMPVDEAMENLSSELRDNPSILMDDAKLDTMYFMQPIPKKTSRITNNVWNKMKLNSAKDHDDTTSSDWD